MQQKKAKKKKLVRKSIKKTSKKKVSKKSSKLEAALAFSEVNRDTRVELRKLAAIDMDSALKKMALDLERDLGISQTIGSEPTVETIEPKELGFFGKIMKFLFNKQS